MAEKKRIYTGGSWEVEAEQRDRRPKIIDAHYHIFPRLGSQREGIAPELRTRIWQYHSREWNNFWRKSDGAHVTDHLLQFPSNNLDDLPDLNFHLTDHGQAEFTLDGADYVMQLFPPSLTNNEATPERMVAEMNMVGVDAGVLQADHAYGDLNEYYHQAMVAYPGRFIDLAQIWEPEADDPARLERLERGFSEFGNQGLYFSVEPLTIMRQDVALTDPKLDALWALVNKYQLPVLWYLDDRTTNRVEMFMRRIKELHDWSLAYPGTTSVITHGLVPAAIIQQIGIPEEVMAVLELPNVLAEALFPPKSVEYPYPEGQAMMRQLRDRVGAEKLLWGSDSPFGMSAWCTYRQSLDFIRVHCDFLSQDEKDLILGVNAARLFGIEPHYTE